MGAEAVDWPSSSQLVALAQSMALGMRPLPNAPPRLQTAPESELHSVDTA
jgi:hypothetical protein